MKLPQDSLELSMSVTHVASNIKARFNYLHCLDLIVFVCIVVIAGRPDGLAITFSALIVGVGAVIYRSAVSIKSRLSAPAPPRRKAAKQVEQRVQPAAAPAASVPAEPKSRSWLRDSE
jgi:hypothetical protein